MKITVLVDNNTYIDQYYYGEPAACYLVEINNHKILFDTGYSDIFLKNAEKLNINLTTLTDIIFSHGHNDHTNGLPYLPLTEMSKNLKIIAHPHALLPKRAKDEYIGPPKELQVLTDDARMIKSSEVYFVTDSCVFLGEIPRVNNFEAQRALGEQFLNGAWQEDFLLDDSALVCRLQEGLFIITGCSHSGICNIIERAKKVFAEERISGVLGGFHLLANDEKLEQTIKYLQKQDIQALYPCHCVSLEAKAKMMSCLAVHEVGVGLTITKI